MDDVQLAGELSRMHVDNARALLRLGDMLSDSGEAGVLMWLTRRDEGVYAVEISQHLGLTQGRVANIVKKLEGKGYITRSHTSDDQRFRRIRMTGEGRRQAQALMDHMDEGHLAMIRALGPGDGAELVRLLGRITELIDKMDVVK